MHLDKSIFSTFFILDFGLHILNRIRWFNFQSDGLSGQSLDEDLHFLPTHRNKDKLEMNVTLLTSVTQ